MAEKAEWPEWLEKLSWREAWLTLEATVPIELPPYLGSTIRGALGHLLRSSLCDGAGCGNTCLQPEQCRYYSLFERNPHQAKPFVLLAPPPPGLEEIAAGGPVNLPYRTGTNCPNEPVPTLRCEAAWKFDPGGQVSFGMRLFGPVASSLPAIIGAISRYGLTLGGAPFRLVSARDAFGRVLYNRCLLDVPVQLPAELRLPTQSETCHRIRILFLSPVVFKVDRSPTFSPADFAARFFDHCVGRAVQMHWECSGTRVPWLELPPNPIRLANHRIFHYLLPRHSFRQDKWLDFDGAVGYLDLTGDLCSLLPWARSAEILHFGQKAAFGLGKIRVLVLE